MTMTALLRLFIGFFSGPFQFIKLTILIVLLAIAGVISPPAASAQQNLDIVAIVNNEVISRYDLEARIDLVIFSSNLQNNDITRQHIAKQTLKALIDETLKRQAADEANIQVSNQDIDRQIAYIEQRNNLQSGEFSVLLKQAGVDMETLRTQVKAQIAWAKLIGALFGNAAIVSPEAISNRLALLQQKQGNPQKYLREIFIPGEMTGERETSFQMLQQMMEQLREGASFTGLAQNFSQSPTATEGGDRGWVSLSELGPELQQAVAALKPGQISNPVQTPEGFYILQVVDERQETNNDIPFLDLGRITIPYKRGVSETEQAKFLQQVETIRSEVKSCTHLEQVAKQWNGAKASITEDIKQTDMSNNMQTIVAALEEGEASEPIQTGNDLIILVVCDRKKQAVPLPSRQQIRQELRQELLHQMARQYLRDLHQIAFIDVRL